MNVRAAQVRDHDELLQIIAKAQLRCPALAQVSSRQERFSDYALAHLITQQGPEDKVLVAQLGGQLVGCMAVTSMVDVSPLQQNFDLQVYDQLVLPEVYEAALAAHEQRHASTIAGGDAAAGMVGASDAGRDTGQQGLVDTPDSKQLLADVLQELLHGDTMPNAFAMTMLCCEPESQQKAASLALLAAAFDAFPDKDYCLLTLPPDSPEVPLLANFTRLPPPPGAALVEVLYLFHRCALLQDFQIQFGTSAHVEEVQQLLSGVADMSVAMTAFADGMHANTAFVASCQGQVIGMATIQPFTDLSQLQHNFNTASVPGLSGTTVADMHIMQLTSFCLNPIFAQRAEQFLMDILKRCNSQLLLYLLQPDQGPLEVTHVFRQVAPRHRLQAAPAGLQAGFALFAFWPGAATRTPVNSHVVVAGASDCGLSIIESLVLNNQLAFNALTLLAPGGLSDGNPSALYNADLLARLGLHASVNVVDAQLVSIDRGQQCIVLSDKHTVQYGVLVLTMGLQCESLLSNQAGLSLPQVVSLQGLPDSMPEGVAQMGSIIVHGPALEACTALAHLQAAGVDLQRVKHLQPANRGSGLSVLQELAGLALPGASQAAGVALPTAIQVDGLTVQPADGTDKLLVSMTRGGQVTVQEADLLVLAPSRCEVPSCIVKAARQSNLVCDGRLVVDAAFRTFDPKILAAGPIAKFSRRYGNNLCHSRYNSQEMGQRVADSLTATFSSPYLGDSQLPQLTFGRLTTTALPGGGLFAYAFAAGLQQSGQEGSQGNRRLASQSLYGYCQLIIDGSNTIQSALLSCAQQQHDLSPAMLLSFIGLPVSYLHELLHSYEAGKVQDLREYLTQPWTGLYYFDRFPQLRAALMQTPVGTGRPLQELDVNSTAISDEVAVTRVQNDVVDFLKQQGTTELPQYNVSAYIS